MEKWTQEELDEYLDKCKKYVKSINLSNKDLSGLDFSKRVFKRDDFRGSDLTGANFSYVKFRGSWLFYYDLRENGFSLKGVNFEGVDFSGVVLKNTVFIDCNLDCAKLTAKQKLDASFVNCTGFITQAELDKHLDRCKKIRILVNLPNKDLSGLDFSKRFLKGAKLSGANLTDANLTGANLKGVDLGGANLIDTDLTEAQLSHANLKKACLEGANLRGAKFKQCVLINVTLSDEQKQDGNFIDCIGLA